MDARPVFGRLRSKSWPLKTVSPSISEPESSVRADASAIAYVVQAERFFIQERFPAQRTIIGSL